MIAAEKNGRHARVGRDNQDVRACTGMTVAAIDRLVHPSTIFELDQVESYRGKEAARQQKIQRDNDKVLVPFDAVEIHMALAQAA